jgi:hypothetical protein
MQRPHINISGPCHELKPSVHMLEQTCTKARRGEEEGGKIRNFKKKRD